MRLFFVRHGETDHNVERRIQGPLLDDPLNERGRLQAAALERHFDALRLDGLRLAAVYSSPMKRAWETAIALARGAHAPGPIAESGFTEFSWGKYLGERETDDVLAAMKRYHAAWRSGQDDVRVEGGGESPRSAWGRASLALERILARHPRDAIAIVAHGRINKIMLSSLVLRDRSQMEQFPQGNTSFTLVEAPDGATLLGPWRVAYLNRKDHLAGLPDAASGTGAEGEPPLV